MKKFYVFAAAAIATVSMNAQLYVVGAGEGLAWAPDAPFEVELADDGTYTFEIKSLTQFKMSKVKGDWAAFNNGSYFATVTGENLGTPIALESMEGVENPGNIETPWKGDYKIVVAGDYSTITMTTTTQKPDENAAKVFYVRGDMNSFGVDEAWQFKQVEGNVYAIDCKIEMGMKFKIADADWDKINYTANRTIYSDEEDLWIFGGSDNDTIMGEDFDGTITVTLPEVLGSGSELPVVFTADAGVSDIAADNAAKEYFNLQGVRVAQPEAGLYIVRQGDKVSKQLVK